VKCANGTSILNVHILLFQSPHMPVVVNTDFYVQILGTEDPDLCTSHCSETHGVSLLVDVSDWATHVSEIDADVREIGLTNIQTEKI